MSRDGRPPTRSESRDQKAEDPSAGDSFGGHASGGSRLGDEDPESSGTSFGVEGAKASAPIWMRLSGAGLELAFITIAFGTVGALIDNRVQTDRPIWSAMLGLLGFTFGMVRFIRLATSISQTQREIESQRSFNTRKENKSVGCDEDARRRDETNQETNQD